MSEPQGKEIPRSAVLSNSYAASGADRTRPPLAQLGRYLLLNRLGEGGMGLVYAAYDPDLDRRVALKLLRPNTPGDAELARARLLREAQAMARVSHPNVVPVFDVGILGDQVFVAMELADGGTLSEWIKAQTRSWQELLEVFLKAGEGLLAAHEAGLVHRDFKPANVLLGRDGRVRVTDFGLALKVHASAEDLLDENTATESLSTPISSERRMLEQNITETGLVMGTPNYMSPEQFAGEDVDARSDQFSFCVSLYTALFRRRPFDPVSMRQAVQSRSRPSDETGTVSLSPRKATDKVVTVPQVIEEPPRDIKIPVWVRRAVMRGLAMEPAARFDSMRGLLRALSQERTRQHQRKILLFSGVGVLSAAAVVAFAYQRTHVCTNAGQPMEDVWGPLARQQLEASFQNTKLPFAPDLAHRVAGVLDTYALSWKQQSVAACEATRRQGAQTEDLLSRREACLERRRHEMRALLGVFAQADRPVVEKSLDAALALPSLQDCADLEALTEQRRLPAEPTRRLEIQRLERRLAELKVLLNAGRTAAAKALAQELEAPILAAQHSPLSAELHYIQGALKLQAVAGEEALPELWLAAQEAEASRMDRLKIAALSRIFVLQANAKRTAEADAWSGMTEAALRRIDGDPELEGEVAISQGQKVLAEGRQKEARVLLERALVLNARILPAGHPKLGRITFLLGVTLYRMKERAQAAEMLTQALKQTEAALGPLHPDTARRHSLLGVVLRELGELPKALEHAQAAVKILKATLGEGDLVVGAYTDEVGQCLLGLKRYPEALEAYRQALEIKRKLLPPDGEPLQYSYDGVGQALLAMDQPREAIEPLRKAASFVSVSDDVRADSGFALARALWRTGRTADARAEAEKAREGFARAGQEQRADEVTAWMTALPRSVPASARSGRR